MIDYKSLPRPVRPLLTKADTAKLVGEIVKVVLVFAIIYVACITFAAMINAPVPHAFVGGGR